MSKKDESQDLLEFVPSALRQRPDSVNQFKVDSEDMKAVIRALVPQYLRDSSATTSEAIYYTLGAMAHQDLVDDSASGRIPCRIKEVEYFDKSDNGNDMPGKKARIHFVNNDGEDEHLDTEFVEFKYQNDQIVWNTAMARTIASIAEENIGKKAVLTKYVIPLDGNKKSRFAIDISINWKQDDDDRDDDRGSRSNKSSGSSSSKKPSRDEDEGNDDDKPLSKAMQKLNRALDEFDPDNVLTKKQVRALEDLAESNAGEDDFLDLISEDLGVKIAAIEELSDENNLLSWAVDTYVLAINE